MHKQTRKRNGQYSRLHWRKRLDNAEMRKAMFMFCLVVWSVVIFADYPRYADATPAVWVIENRESLQITPLGGTKGEEHDGLVEAGPKAIIDEGDGSDALVVISESPASIEEKIRKAWAGTGEEEIAVAVFKSESGLIADNIGDKNLTFVHNGQVYGRSIGIAQIRTGGIEKSGKVWVRSDNVAEFEKQMMNPDKNIEFARGLYDRHWFYPWSNYKNGAYLSHL